MLLSILEGTLLILGIIICATGKVPSFLHDNDKHPLLAEEARLMGALLLMPLPLALTWALMINAVFTEQSLAHFLGWTEPIATTLTLFLFVLLQAFLQRSSVSVAPTDASGRDNWDDRKAIAFSGRRAILFQVIGTFILTAPVFLPLSWRRADEARRVSRRVGHSADYGRLGAILRVSGRVIFWIYFIVIIWIAARLMTMR